MVDSPKKEEEEEALPRRGCCGQTVVVSVRMGGFVRAKLVLFWQADFLRRQDRSIRIDGSV